ncbi:MAG: hypothetical protein Q9190_004867 [Brigantiaea leucoxantha]
MTLHLIRGTVYKRTEEQHSLSGKRAQTPQRAALPHAGKDPSPTPQTQFPLFSQICGMMDGRLSIIHLTDVADLMSQSSPNVTAERDEADVRKTSEVNGVTKLKFDSVEDTVDAFRKGSFIIVLDSPSRENEGDLIIAAQDVTPDKMAFMIRHTSGLVCAPVSPALATSLMLPQMVPSPHNTEMDSTAYTISVDAVDQTMSTGISAHDRALTCRMLASPESTGACFRRPGHVFPLRARAGGVRERRGHTEATIEFCRLAGKMEAGIVSELVIDGEEVEGTAERRGGGMLDRDGCLKFGRRWEIKVCTIEDLVEYLEERGIKGGGGRETNNVMSMATNGCRDEE